MVCVGWLPTCSLQTLAGDRSFSLQITVKIILMYTLWYTGAINNPERLVTSERACGLVVSVMKLL